MRRNTLLGVVLVLALALAACAPSATEIPTLSVPVTGPSDTPAAVMTDTPAETATEAAVETPTTEATEAATEAATSAAGVSIMTSTSADVSEPFLVDQDGRTLYVTSDDTQNSGTSSCTDSECTTEWPAVIVTGTPTAGTGVDASMLGTITREDGTMQATYNGWPLYYFSEDTAAGDMNGKGMEDAWFLVSAAGTAIQQ
jgi:predicted lipoprotein with Yx(FWY)xxD motif